MRLIKNADGVLKYAGVSRIADVLKKLADVLKKLADVRLLMLADVRNLQIADVMIFCLDSCSLEISDILANVLARYQPDISSSCYETKSALLSIHFLFQHLLLDMYAN